jgi:hypothetical protein
MSKIFLQVLIHSPNQKQTYATPTVTKHLVKILHNMEWIAMIQTRMKPFVEPPRTKKHIMFKIQKCKCTFLTK